MTLPAFAAMHYAAVPLLLGTWHPQLSIDLLPTWCSAANPPHAAAAVGQTDGRTDTRPFHKPYSAYHAGSVNNILQSMQTTKATNTSITSAFHG